MKQHTIGAVSLGATQNGQRTIDLWSKDTRLKYPVLRLFDLSELATIGLDPTTITTDKTPIRCIAYYTESEKTNTNGKPYLDVDHLEPIIQPAGSSDAHLEPILKELAAIKTMLALLIENLPKPETTTPEPETTTQTTDAYTKYANGELVNRANEAESTAYNLFWHQHGRPPDDRADLRAYHLKEPPYDLPGFS